MEFEDLIQKGIYKGNTFMLPKKSIQQIIDNLIPKEEIIILTNCNAESHPGAIAVTNKRVIFCSKVFFSTFMKDFDLKKITSTNFESHMTNKMTIQGSSDKITITAIDKKVGQEIVNKIKELQLSTEPSNTSSGTIADLEKLAELKEKGIITEEEFNAKKKQILGL